MNLCVKLLVLLLIAGIPSGVFAKEKEEAAAKTRLHSPGVIILTDEKEVDRLIAALESKPAPAVEKKTVGNGFPEDIRGQLLQTWRRISSAKAFSMRNLYMFVGGLLLTFLTVLLVRWIVDKLTRRCLAGRISGDIDSRLSLALRTPIEMILYTVGFYLSAFGFIYDMPHQVQDGCSKLVAIIIAAAFGWTVYRLADLLFEGLAVYASKSASRLDDLIVTLFHKIIRIMIIIITIMLIGQNILGINIGTLLAGAGIFGLALAFAAQDTIANFFGSIMIVFDKPFFIGDRIKVGDVSGTVKSVGFRSTRLETLDGHMLTLPNKKITESVVENISLRPFIKFDSNLTLVYSTTPQQMEQAMAILHELLDNHDGMDPERPPRIFFSAFNDWSLNIKYITWFHPGDWAASMEWQSRINLEILRRFNAAGLSFAFPTNTTYVINEENDVFRVGLKNDVIDGALADK